ncbi:MAG: hypothetical protein KBT20_10825 [Bacteroidales bacterium]|nr:hypothetical protein [Candidatus Liminaster caballi]
MKVSAAFPKTWEVQMKVSPGFPKIWEVQMKVLAALPKTLEVQMKLSPAFPKSWEIQTKVSAAFPKTLEIQMQAPNDKIGESGRFSTKNVQDKQKSRFSPSVVFFIYYFCKQNIHFVPQQKHSLTYNTIKNKAYEKDFTHIRLCSDVHDDHGTVHPSGFGHLE